MDSASLTVTVRGPNLLYARGVSLGSRVPQRAFDHWVKIFFLFLEVSEIFIPSLYVMFLDNPHILNTLEKPFLTSVMHLVLIGDVHSARSVWDMDS